MTFINYAAKEINCKIVYYGPGLGGKTTNLQYIFDRTSPERRGRMISLATETDRTLFFDFLPLDLGKIRGFSTRFHLYTVPGQVFYEASRKLILKGVDGVVFVADSLKIRHERNMLSLKNLSDNLKSYDLNIMKIPLVLQYNKRDLDQEGLPLLPIEKMERTYNRQLKAPSFAASAISGKGVNDTLKACLIKTLKSLRGKVGWE